MRKVISFTKKKSCRNKWKTLAGKIFQPYGTWQRYQFACNMCKQKESKNRDYLALCFSTNGPKKYSIFADKICFDLQTFSWQLVFPVGPKFF